MDDAESFQSSMSSESVYEVESILDSREQDGRTEYRVRWKGWEAKWDTWEPIENLLSCQELLTAFHLARQTTSTATIEPPHIEIETEEDPVPSSPPKSLRGKKRGATQPRKGRTPPTSAPDVPFARPLRGRGSRGGRTTRKSPDRTEVEPEKSRVRGGGRGGRRGRGGRGGGRSQARVSSPSTDEEKETSGRRRSSRVGRGKATAEKESDAPEMDIDDEENQAIAQVATTSPPVTPVLETIPTPDGPPGVAGEQPRLVELENAGVARAPSSETRVQQETLCQTRQKRRLEKEAEATKILGLSFENDINEFRKNQMREYQRLDTVEAQCLSRDAFIEAVKCADLKALRKAFAAMKQRKEKMEKGIVTSEGETMVVAATKLLCEKSHSADDVIEMLVQNGADVNERGRGGRTALHWAAERGFLCKISKLLSLGAHVNVYTDVDASPNSCETPLFIACRKGFAHCAYRLLEYGADCGAINGQGEDLLIVANKSRSHQTIDLITKHIEKLKLGFEGELQLLFPPGASLKIKQAVFPNVRCFPLSETNEVVVPFNNRVPVYANSHNRIGFLLCMGVAKLTNQQVSIRFWGPSPIGSVLLNGVELQSMQENSNFVMHMKSLVPGGNELVIKLSPQAAKSQMRLVVQAFLVSMPVEEARRLSNVVADDL